MRVDSLRDDALRPGGNENFVGDAFVQPLVSPGDGLDIILVHFHSGARTYLHRHTVPQVLHCVEGKGILATESERNQVGPGDVVYVPAGETHWHGAREGSSFTHISIRPPGDNPDWTTTDPLAG